MLAPPRDFRGDPCPGCLPLALTLPLTLELPVAVATAPPPELPLVSRASLGPSSCADLRGEGAKGPFPGESADAASATSLGLFPGPAMACDL